MFERIRTLRNAMRAKNAEYYNNRRLSKSVRDLLKEGRLQEAREACAAQTDEAIRKLAQDEPYRTQYFELWDQQRARVAGEQLQLRSANAGCL